MPDPTDYNRKLIDDFRAHRHEPGGPFSTRPLLLLTTTGAKTGLPRTTPMMAIPDGDRLLVVASNAGAPTHPAWYHNLRAHPQVTVEVGTDTFEATAAVAGSEERPRLWAQIVEKHPFFGEYQAKITREIPVVVLTRHKG
jgi:deazaflavin-dependent oxidoreductase (nitroreductase family)